MSHYKRNLASRKKGSHPSLNRAKVIQIRKVMRKKISISFCHFVHRGHTWREKLYKTKSVQS